MLQNHRLSEDEWWVRDSMMVHNDDLRTDACMEVANKYVVTFNFVVDTAIIISQS